MLISRKEELCLDHHSERDDIVYEYFLNYLFNFKNEGIRTGF